uniref:Putative lobe n=1 Tax=Nyssomyia neivai TaxID=330878 RepID=A0A1L8DDC0_9DIPT
MIIACNCLNIVIGISDVVQVLESPQVADSKVACENFLQTEGKTNLSIFFREALGPFHAQQISLKKEQSDLVHVINLGNWSIHQCINCRHLCVFALLEKEGVIICNSKLMTNQEEINALKASSSYSTVFSILMDQQFPEEEVFKTNKLLQIHPKVKNLTQQFQQHLQRETAATDERIQRYTEHQFTLLKIFRERSEQELQILMSLVCRLPETLTLVTETRTQQQISSNLETPPSTPDTPMTIGSSPPMAVRVSQGPTMSTSSSGASSPMPMRGTRRHSANRSGDGTKMRHHADADSECFFPIEGMENDMGPGGPQDMSDLDESDSENYGDDDQQTMCIPRQMARQASMSIAKSLPISMPAVMDRSIEDDFDDQPIDEKVDIAASIKALAKSVHGDAVFGDLPRPRFSTQI